MAEWSWSYQVHAVITPRMSVVQQNPITVRLLGARGTGDLVPQKYMTIVSTKICQEDTRPCAAVLFHSTNEQNPPLLAQTSEWIAFKDSVGQKHVQLSKRKHCTKSAEHFFFWMSVQSRSFGTAQQYESIRFYKKKKGGHLVTFQLQCMRWEMIHKKNVQFWWALFSFPW